MRLDVQSPAPKTLFENVASQFFANLIDPAEVGEALREKIVVEGETLSELLREWVEALINLVRVQHMVFKQFRVTRLETPEKGPYSLQAEAVGELVDSQRHTLPDQAAWIKCRQAELRKTPQGYQAEIELAE